jgi:hypothetical protein
MRLGLEAAGAVERAGAVVDDVTRRGVVAVRRERGRSERVVAGFGRGILEDRAGDGACATAGQERNDTRLRRPQSEDVRQERMSSLKPSLCRDEAGRIAVPAAKEPSAENVFWL